MVLMTRVSASWITQQPQYHKDEPIESIILKDLQGVGCYTVLLLAPACVEKRNFFRIGNHGARVKQPPRNGLATLDPLEGKMFWQTVYLAHPN